MFAKGLATRETAVLVALNADEVQRFITRKDRDLDDLVIDSALKQIETGVAPIPKKGNRIMVVVSLSASEVERLKAHESECEEHFLEIATRYTENEEHKLVMEKAR